MNIGWQYEGEAYLKTQQKTTKKRALSVVMKLMVSHFGPLLTSLANIALQKAK